MGCCRKTVTQQYWNVVTTPLAKGVSENFRTFAIYNEQITGTPYFDSLEYLENNSSRKIQLRWAAEKFNTTKFYTGFAKVIIGSNALPVDAIKQILSPGTPESILIISGEMIPLNYVEWVEKSLTVTFPSYNSSTKKFTAGGLIYTVNLSTANAETNTVTYTKDGTTTTLTLDIPPEPIADSLVVTYSRRLDATWVDGYASETWSLPVTWVYDMGSDIYPQLEMYTQIPDKDPTIFKVFPEIPIRQNNVSYPSFTSHPDTAAYAKLLGVDLAQIAGAFAGNSDMDKLDHIGLGLGINLEARDKYSLRYCADFTNKVIEVIASRSIAGSRIVSTAVSAAYARTSLGGLFGVPTLLAPFVQSADLPGIELIFDFKAFSYTLKVSGAYKTTLSNATLNTAPYAALKTLRDSFRSQDQTVYGRIAPQGQELIYGSKVSDTLSGLYALGVTHPDASAGAALISSIGEGSGNYAHNNIITYFVVHYTGDMECYTLVQPVISHKIVDAASGQVRTMYVDLQSTHGGNTNAADIFFPLDWQIVKKYEHQVVTSLVGGSLYLTMYYAYFHQEKVWDFGVLAIIILILVAIFAPYLLVNAFNALAGTISTTLGVSLATAQIVAAVLLLASTGVFGEDAALIATVALMAFGLMDPEFAVGLNRQTFTLVSQATDIMNTFVMEDLLGELEKLQNELATHSDENRKSVDLWEKLLKDLGYYFKQSIKKYTAISLVGQTYTATLIPMPPKVYLDTVLHGDRPDRFLRKSLLV